MSGSCLIDGQDKNLHDEHLTPPFFAAPNTSTATSCAKSLPFFAAPMSCAKSFTCVLCVSTKGTRVFGVGSELADDDGQDKHLPTRPPFSTRALGVSPKGSAGAECVCWACLKFGREDVCLKK